MEDTRGTGPLNQLIKAHMSSQRKKQQTQGLSGSAPGSLCIYYSFQLSIYTRLLSVWMSGSLILVSLLGLLLLLLVCLV